MNPISLPMRQEPLPRPSSHPLPTLNPPSHQLKKQSSHLESHQGNILDSLPMSSHHHHKPGVLTFPPPPGSTPTFQALSQGIVTPSSYSGIPHVHDVSPLLELCPDSCERSGDETTPPPAWRHVLSPKSHMKHHEWTSLHNKKPSAKSLKTSHPSDHGIPIHLHHINLLHLFLPPSLKCLQYIPLVSYIINTHTITILKTIICKQ